ncbi:MAG: FABP family protein [Acidimicrobiia bacterium]|nr:FABP family protein [Acidimicrobiia bacterium]
MKPAIHPDVRPLAFLLGTWNGTGRGEYPTIDSFEYGEEIHITHVGKPFLAYRQRTWSLSDHAPLHSEAGYFRSGGDGVVQLIIAQPTGIAEMHIGPLVGSTIDLRTAGVLLTPTAKRVTSVGRRIEVANAALSYRLFMEAVDQPYQFHLEAELHRTE